ncbi:MAG: GNAT family N-acetyltransferase [Phototrophicaceae bacterium]|jgi:N-acetylglutamate synthase-like GNAT family acetyltransferase
MATQVPVKITTTEKLAVNIRKATAQDLYAIEVFIEQFVATGDVLPRTLGELEQLYPTCYVAEYDGEIVGTAILEVYSWKLAEIRSLCVSPTVQGQGVGKRLVTACVELARERDILEVMAITRSEEFFASCGFDFTLPSMKKALFLQTRDDLTHNE